MAMSQSIKPRQRIEVVSSKNGDAFLAVDEIIAQLDDSPLAGGIIFCSHHLDWEDMARAVSDRLNDVTIFGCTSSGEINALGYDTDSLTFIAFPLESFCVDILAFEDIENFDHPGAGAQVRQLVASSQHHSAALGEQINQAALFLVDGLSQREELLTMTIQDSLGKIPLIGGSAGDGMAYTQTGVFHHGRFHNDSAIIAIISSTKPMHVFRAQHYRPGSIKAVVTGARCAEREVYEINGRPASEEYLRMVGRPGAELDQSLFASNPPMVRAGGDYYVRAIRNANADGSLTFHCAIDEGMVLTLGEPHDRIAGMTQTFAEAAAQVGDIDHIIGFDCILNRIDAEQRQIDREVSKLYVRNHVAGFNTYGEQFHFAHVNQTFCGLAIGR